MDIKSGIKNVFVILERTLDRVVCYSINVDCCEASG